MKFINIQYYNITVKWVIEFLTAALKISLFDFLIKVNILEGNIYLSIFCEMKSCWYDHKLGTVLENEVLQKIETSKYVYQKKFSGVQFLSSLLLNLWTFFTVEPLRLSECCWTFELYVLLNLWDYLFAAEPLDFLYCWTFEILCLLVCCCWRLIISKVQQ